MLPTGVLTTVIST